MRLKKCMIILPCLLLMCVFCACGNRNTAQSQSQSSSEYETVTETQAESQETIEAPTELDREIIPQDNVDKEIVTLTEAQFKQYFEEEEVRLTYYFMNDNVGSYEEIIKKYGATKTVYFKGDRYSSYVESGSDLVSKEHTYTARAYAIYKSPYGGYLYVYFVTESDEYDYWTRSHAVYRENILSYEDFGDLTGKTAEDVEKIDGIVKYHKAAATGSSLNPNMWESYHLLEDGILEISYSTQDNKIIQVRYEDNYVYIWGPEYRFDFILEEQCNYY